MRMLVMAAHEIRSLGAVVTGTVADDYDPAWLCDGETNMPVRIDATSLSLSVPLASGTVDGLVVTHHNLEGEIDIDFSGLGTVETPAVPPGGIRKNAYTRLSTPAGGGGSTTFSLTATSPIIIGEAFVGLFREVWPVPTETPFPHEAFQIRHPGEYRGLSYSKGAQAIGPFGGTIWLVDDDYEILRDAYLASEENSLPTVIVVLDDPTFDFSHPMVVTWESFVPKAVRDDLWQVEVSWLELPRFRWRQPA